MNNFVVFPKITGNVNFLTSPLKSVVCWSGLKQVYISLYVFLTES